MSVLVSLCNFLHYMFRPLLVAIFRWFVIQKIRRQLLYMSMDPLRQSFGVTLYARHDLLKYVFALHISFYIY
jgi:hypothetical protein